MPGFEFLLDFGDDRQELRIGDRPARLGGRMTILGREWVVDDFIPREGRMLGRFRLSLADDTRRIVADDDQVVRERSTFGGGVPAHVAGRST